ncbi:hypothetical protein Tco_0335058, partial [Tanacetum coccineum]
MFEEIIDFLNTSSVQYALTVNPTIYTTCIEQFWTSTKAKIVNGERQIQALVDKKKVIIIEMSIRSDLNLDDAEGTDCLPTATIFSELERMGYENLTQKLTFYKAYFSSQWKFLIHTILQCLSAKTTSKNEFSSTMTSAIICLATNKIFNFSKYIFDNMVKNLEGGVKFFMYLRFVQVFLDKQVEGMSRHKGIYVIPSHTKKVFANIKRPGKGFSRKVTPLFETMMVQAAEDMGEDSTASTDSHSTPIHTQLSSSKPQNKKSRRKQRKDSGPIEPIPDEAINEEHVANPSCDPPQSGEDRMQLTELMDLCTQLQSRVLALETTKSNQALEIESLKKRVKSLEKRRKSRTPGFKILKKGRKIADAEVTLVDETQEMNDDNMMFDTVTTADEVVTIANVKVTISNAPTTTIDELTLAQTLIEIKAAKPKVVTSATITTTTTRPKARGVVVQEPSEFKTTSSPLQASQLPQAKDKGKEMFDKEMKRVNTFVDIDIELVKGSKTKAEGSFKRAREELESDNSKKQWIDKHVEAKGNDDQEEAEIKKNIEIVQDDEVAIDAIPQDTKPPVIVEWKIIKKGNMGYFQLIRADGSSKSYSSMIQMLQNIDREDLETL